MRGKKCPRVGSRVKFDANPVSAALYRAPVPRSGEVGTVVSVPLPGVGRKTCTGGHSQDLVYVDWPSAGVMGTARADLQKAKGKGPVQMQVNGLERKKKSAAIEHYRAALEMWRREPLAPGRTALSPGQAATQAAYDAAINAGVRPSELEGVSGLSDLGDAPALSIGQRVMTPHGAGTVRSKLGAHVGVALDDGSVVQVHSSEVSAAGGRQSYFNGLGMTSREHRERAANFEKSAKHIMQQTYQLIQRGMCGRALVFYADGTYEMGASEHHAFSAGEDELNEDFRHLRQSLEQEFRKKCLREKAELGDYAPLPEGVTQGR